MLGASFRRVTSGLVLGFALSQSVSCLAMYERMTSVNLKDIRDRGRLIAITAYGPNSYFLYRGEPMGYEHDLLENFAKYLGVRLEVVVTGDMENLAYMLNSRRADLVAGNITVTRQLARSVQFTDHFTLSRQVLVQRKAGSPPGRSGVAAPIVKTTIDLIGKQVHVREGSAFHERLRNLSDEIGGDIVIVKEPGDMSTEDLIKKVALGEIDYTVADEGTALINAAYYSSLDVQLPIAFPQRVAWVVRNRSPELLTAANQWITEIRQSQVHAAIYNRYYADPRQFRESVGSEYSSLAGGKISPYDDEIKKRAAAMGWDWRLLASLVYQESRFNPQATSWAGAQGLMQIMPSTAAELGVRNTYDPSDNLQGGIRHLKWLFEYWKAIKDPEEKLRFILASYNAGHGHVEDARRLAAKSGRSPDKWLDNVELSMLDLARPEFYNDPVVQYGYCRGEEPYLYVRQILDRYDHYKKFVK